MSLENELSVLIAENLFPGNPQAQQDFLMSLEENRQKWDAEFKPFEDAVKRSMILSAKDYATTITPCYD